MQVRVVLEVLREGMFLEERSLIEIPHGRSWHVCSEAISSSFHHIVESQMRAVWTEIALLLGMAVPDDDVPVGRYKPV